MLHAPHGLVVANLHVICAKSLGSAAAYCAGPRGLPGPDGKDGADGLVGPTGKPAACTGLQQCLAPQASC
jgi:hypothetical protein